MLLMQMEAPTCGVGPKSVPSDGHTADRRTATHTPLSPLVSISPSQYIINQAGLTYTVWSDPFSERLATFERGPTSSHFSARAMDSGHHASSPSRALGGHKRSFLSHKRNKTQQTPSAHLPQPRERWLHMSRLQFSCGGPGDKKEDTTRSVYARSFLSLPSAVSNSLKDVLYRLFYKPDYLLQNTSKNKTWVAVLPACHAQIFICESAQARECSQQELSGLVFATHTHTHTQAYAIVCRLIPAGAAKVSSDVLFSQY